MKLTKQQIENLYQFTRQHYVVHFDLQTELVDHMANAIESAWEINPAISFEESRDKSFKTFGVFGFMDVLEHRQKAMSKRYHKILWRFVKEWFSFPEVLKTVLIFISAYFLFGLSYGKYIAIAVCVVLFITVFCKGIKFSKYIKKKENPDEKLWLLEDIIFRYASANIMVFASSIFNFFNISEAFWNYQYSALIMAIFFTLFAIYSYVSVMILPKNAEKLLKNTYPEYSLI
jgi:hypothetical protein